MAFSDSLLFHFPARDGRQAGQRTLNTLCPHFPRAARRSDPRSQQQTGEIDPAHRTCLVLSLLSLLSILGLSLLSICQM